MACRWLIPFSAFPRVPSLYLLLLLCPFFHSVFLAYDFLLISSIELPLDTKSEEQNYIGVIGPRLINDRDLIHRCAPTFIS